MNQNLSLKIVIALTIVVSPVVLGYVGGQNIFERLMICGIYTIAQVVSFKFFSKYFSE